MSKPLHLRAATTSSLTVDSEIGVIFGAAIITAGKTKPSAGDGSVMMIDRVTLQQVADAVNAGPCKVRMTHAELHSGDDLLFRVGTIQNARIVGDKVLGDVHFYNPSDPDALRVLAIAATDPGSLGLSISTDRFNIEPGDALRISALSAVDLVGTPAANPAGLLSAQLKEHEMDTKGQEGKGTGAQAIAEIKRLTDAGMTLEDIAGKVNRDAGTLSQINAGDIANPPQELLDALKGITAGNAEGGESSVTCPHV